MNKFFILILSISYLTSCNKNNKNTPTQPNNYNVDIDNDSNPDYEIRYWSVETHDIPPSSQGITGAIKPLNNNQLLKNQNSALFLKKGDTIKMTDNSNSEWTGYSKSVIGISGSGDIWDEQWSINSDSNFEYYMGVKIDTNNQSKIGWLKLQLNTTNGNISVDKVQLSNNDFIIIE